MEKLTGDEILKGLEERNIPWEDLGDDIIEWEDLPFGKVELIDEYGGENCGSDYWKVYHFIEHDVYIRIDGWYQSYHGTEFNNAPYEVKPQQKVITVYEK